jgi:hypothetical protein
LINERLGERIQVFARDLPIYGELLYRQFRQDLETRPLPEGFARYYNL